MEAAYEEFERVEAEEEKSNINTEFGTTPSTKSSSPSKSNNPSRSRAHIAAKSPGKITDLRGRARSFVSNTKNAKTAYWIEDSQAAAGRWVYLTEFEKSEQERKQAAIRLAAKSEDGRYFEKALLKDVFLQHAREVVTRARKFVEY